MNWCGAGNSTQKMKAEVPKIEWMEKINWEKFLPPPPLLPILIKKNI